MIQYRSYHRFDSWLVAISLYLSAFLAGYAVLTLEPHQTTTEIATHVKIWAWLGWAVLIWSLYSWYKLGKSLINLYIIFYLAAFLFMYGQSLLFALGIEHETRSLFRYLFVEDILPAQVFTCISLSLMHFGALVGIERARHSQSQRAVEVPQDIKYRAVRIVGWILFAISVIPFTYQMVVNVSTVARFGYAALYGYEGDIVSPLLRIGRVGKILISFADYFTPAIICLFVGYKGNPKILRGIIFLVLVIVLFKLYIGGRSLAVIQTLCIVFLFHVVVRPLKSRDLVMGSIITFLGAGLLTTIADIRSVPGRTLTYMFEVFVENIGKKNPIVDSVSELGGSMFPLIKIMQIVPSHYPLRYGTSYLYALTSIIPNLGFWEVHPAGQYAQLGQWLMNILHMSYGPGFSPTAEAFANFGWFGAFLFPIYGFAYACALGMANKDNAAEKPAELAVMAILFANTVMTNRNDFIFTVRSVFYFALPILFFSKIVLNRIVRYRYLKNPEVCETSRSEIHFLR